MIFSRGEGRRTVFTCLLVCLAALSANAAERAAVETVEISARPITQFHIGHDEKRFGPLEFVGGLEMTSPSGDFGALSALRFLKPGSDFIGVADTGFWFFGTITHDADKRPSGIRNFRMQRMVDASGRAVEKKGKVDAEGLAVKDGIATVGFERDHRVVQFRIDPDDMKAPFRALDFLIPARELRQNRGFETVAQADPPQPSPGRAGRGFGKKPRQGRQHLCRHHRRTA